MKAGLNKMNWKQSGTTVFSLFIIVSIAASPICLARSVSMHGGSHGISHASHAMHMAPHHFNSVNHTHLNNFHGGAEHNFERGHEGSHFNHEEFGRHNEMGRHEEFGRHNEFGRREEHGFDRRVGHDNFRHDAMARRDTWAGRGDHNLDRHIGADHFRHEEFSRHDGLRGDEHRHLGEHRHLSEHFRRHEGIADAASGDSGGGGGGGGFGMPYIVDGGSGTYDSQDDRDDGANNREEDMRRDGQFRGDRR